MGSTIIWHFYELATSFSGSLEGCSKISTREHKSGIVCYENIKSQRLSFFFTVLEIGFCLSFVFLISRKLGVMKSI
jgi:hypothetical protein